MKKIAILSLVAAMANPGNIQASSDRSKTSSNSWYSSALLAGGCPAVAAVTGRFVSKKYDEWLKNRELEKKKAQFYEELKEAFIDSFTPNNKIARYEGETKKHLYCRKVYFYDIARLTIKKAMAKQDSTGSLYPTFENLNQLVTALYMQKNERQSLETTTAKGINSYKLKQAPPFYDGSFASPCSNLELSEFDKQMANVMADQLYSYYTNMDATEKDRIKQNMLQLLDGVKPLYTPQTPGAALAYLIVGGAWTGTNDNVIRILKELLHK